MMFTIHQKNFFLRAVDVYHRFGKSESASAHYKMVKKQIKLLLSKLTGNIVKTQ